MRTLANKWIGRRVTDCIGLIKYYLMADKYGDNPTYLVQYDSLNADGLFRTAKEFGPISTLPEIPGLLLHMSGHVGAYIGGGYAIEAAGTVNGVIKTKVAGRGWDHWYKCIWLQYAATTQPAAASAVQFDTTVLTLAAGGAYQLKTTSSPGTPKLTVAHPGVIQLLPRYRSGMMICGTSLPLASLGTAWGYTATTRTRRTAWSISNNEAVKRWGRQDIIGLIVAVAGCFVGLAGWLSGRDKKS